MFGSQPELTIINCVFTSPFMRMIIWIICFFSLEPTQTDDNFWALFESARWLFFRVHPTWPVPWGTHVWFTWTFPTKFEWITACIIIRWCRRKRKSLFHACFFLLTSIVFNQRWTQHEWRWWNCLDLNSTVPEALNQLNDPAKLSAQSFSFVLGLERGAHPWRKSYLHLESQAR